MHLFDIIFSISLVFAGYRGFKKGFIVVLSSLVALVLGVYAAIYFSDIVAVFLKNQWDIDVPLVPFIITFALVLIGINALGKLIEKLVSAMALGLVNKIAGLLFAAMQMAIFFVVIMAIVMKLNTDYSFFDDTVFSGSLLFPWLVQLESLLFPYFQRFLS